MKKDKHEKKEEEKDITSVRSLVEVLRRKPEDRGFGSKQKEMVENLASALR